MRIQWVATLGALALGALGLLAQPGLAQSMPGARTAAEIAAMDLSAIAAALREDTGAIAVYVAELHRRYPDKIELVDGVELPNVDAQSMAAIRGASDDGLNRSVERVSNEVDQLVARGQILQAAAGGTPAPQSRAPQARTTAAPAQRLQAERSQGDYCYTMYGRAYSLCDREDRSCKMIAANDWDACKKTGRWP